jgi:cytochrome P450
MSSALTITGSKVLDATVLVLLIAYISSWISSVYRLSHIPGPRGWGWSIFPWLKLHTRTDLLDQFNNLTIEYGPLVRVGPKTLICSDPDVMRRLSAPRSPYVRADWYYAMRLNPGEDNIFSTLDETRHDALRRKMAAGYSGKENASLERDVDDCLLELIDLINRKYISKGGDIKHMDLARKIAFFTTDIMSKVAFDGQFHDLRDDKDNMGYIEELENLFPNVTWTATVPGFLKVMTKLGLLQKMAAAGDGSMGVQKVKSIASANVSKRFDAEGKAKENNKQDMLGSFLRHGLTQDEAKQESVLNLLVLFMKEWCQEC